MKGGHGLTNQLHVHEINLGTLDHASCELQLTSCNYYCTCTCAVHGCVSEPAMSSCARATVDLEIFV